MPYHQCHAINAMNECMYTANGEEAAWGVGFVRSFLLYRKVYWKVNRMEVQQTHQAG